MLCWGSIRARPDPEPSEGRPMCIPLADWERLTVGDDATGLLAAGAEIMVSPDEVTL